MFVRMRDGLLTTKFLVDVKNLPGMNDLRFDPLSGLIIGAAVNMNRVIASPEVQEHYPLLADACRSVASYQLRSRATIVGNICNALWSTKHAASQEPTNLIRWLLRRMLMLYTCWKSMEGLRLEKNTGGALSGSG